MSATTRLRNPLGIAGPAIVASVLLISTILLSAREAQASANCAITPEFQALTGQIAETVGPCVENATKTAGSGDLEQRTAAWHGGGGLLVLRQCEGIVAFTDGGPTWLLGPVGLVQRPNDRRFPWEMECRTGHERKLRATVGSVGDGGTIHTRELGSVRAIGIEKVSGACALSAVANARSLAPTNARTWITLDSRGGSDGRGLRYVTVTLEDGTDFGTRLIEAGRARAAATAMHASLSMGYWQAEGECPGTWRTTTG